MEKWRPAVVLTKMTEMHHVCEVDYQGRCDGHQWDGPGMKGESLRTVPKLPASPQFPVSRIFWLLFEFLGRTCTFAKCVTWGMVPTYHNIYLSLEGSFTGLVKAAQANGEKIATYTGVMQVGTWGPAPWMRGTTHVSQVIDPHEYGWLWIYPSGENQLDHAVGKIERNYTSS